MIDSKLAWPIACTALAALSVVLVLVDASATVRAPIVLVFLLVCPGLAIVRFLRLPELAAQAGVAVALSIALVGLVSLIQAYAGVWNPAVGVIAVAAITLTVVLVEVVTRRSWEAQA